MVVIRVVMVVGEVPCWFSRGRSIREVVGRGMVVMRVVMVVGGGPEWAPA